MKTKYPPVYYGDYLGLDKLLSCQRPKSEEYEGKIAHDEMLFIIVHQAYELWFRQILHELSSVQTIFGQEYVNEKMVGICVARLRRVTEIQKLLVDQLHIIETMTPLDFLDFRDFLLPASGFQSYQFRQIENKLGLEPGDRKLFENSSYAARLSKEHRNLISEDENQPSMLQLVNGWLERTPFIEFNGFNFWQSYRASVDTMLENDLDIIKTNPNLLPEERERELTQFKSTREHFEAIFGKSKHDELVKKGLRKLSHKATQAALLINLYRDEPILHLPFGLLTVLIDIDELMTTWRSRHALMVQRMIGTKIGTGGSSGHHYLKVTASSHKVFEDLTNISTFLIPRKNLPELPEDFIKSLGFYHTRKK